MMNLKKILFTIISHMTNDNFSQKICADILTKRCIHIQYHKRIQTKSKFNYNNKAPLIKHSLIHNNNLHQKVTSTPGSNKVPLENYLFSINDITNMEHFIAKLSDLDCSSYTCFVKARFTDNTYRMIGNQFGFIYKGKKDLIDLHQDIINRLESFFEIYNALDIDNTLAINLYFRKLDFEYINHLKVDPSLVDRSDSELINRLKKVTKIPSEGEFKNSLLLNTQMNSDNIVTNIIIEDNIFKNGGQAVNFLDKISEKTKLLSKSHPDRINDFDYTWKFYLIKDNNKRCVLALKDEYQNNIEKIIFSSNGVVLSRIIDTHLYNGDIQRRSNKSTYIIRNNKIVSSYKDILLPKIHKTMKNERDLAPIYDFNIGVIDCETFKDSFDGVNKIYALGLKTNIDKQEYIQYVDNSINSDEIVIKLFDEILRSKYSKVKFYCHNFSNYDLIFMLKAIRNYNNNIRDKYHVSFKYKDQSIISLNVKLRNEMGKITNSVTISDSYFLLNNNLRDLAKDFNVDTLKSVFPYKFANQDTLFYKGKTPDMSYYQDISAEEYCSLRKDDWDFKEESIKYLKDDLNSLFEVINKASEQIWNDYRINMIDSSTISGLAVKLFTRDFYEESIPCINTKSMYNDIKKGYYGGITEVYKPYGNNLYYYDVNSLYPFVALNNSFPGLNCRKETFDVNQKIDNLFGFYYCDIKTPIDSYLGVLPVRKIDGLIFPLGKWKGWYFSEELKFAQEQGYEINVINGYSFNKIDNVFNKYITTIYDKKMNPENRTQKSMSKSLLNNLLGRFGISLDSNITEWKTEKEFNLLSSIKKVSSYVQIDDDNYLVTYKPNLDYEIINSHGLDFSKVLNQHSDKELENRSFASISTSAAVTAYARIYMHKLKLNILKLGGNIYYSDTDSIVTDIELPLNLVDDKEIGKLKLEHKIKTGIFISGKTYGFLDNENNFINKAKGLRKTSLSFHDYNCLYINKDVLTGIKRSSKKDWSVGEVDIYEQNIKLNHDAYKKRTKLYTNEGMWYDTRPLSHNISDVELKLKKEDDILNINNPFIKKPFESGISFASFVCALISISCLWIVNLCFSSDDYNNTESNDLIDFSVPIEITDTILCLEKSNIQPGITELKPYQITDKTTRLLDISSGQESADEYINIHKIPNEEMENENFNRLTDNLHAYYLNNLQNIYPDSTVRFLDPNSEKIIREWLENESVEYMSDSDDEFLQIISEIKEGIDVTIISPTYSNQTDYSINKLSSQETSPVSSISTETNESPVIKKSIIIVTKKVEDGEPIPPLPNWTDNLTKKNYDMIARRKAHMFNSDYVSNHETTPRNLKNTEWMEKEEFGLDNLFSDKK